MRLAVLFLVFALPLDGCTPAPAPEPAVPPPLADSLVMSSMVAPPVLRPGCDPLVLRAAAAELGLPPTLPLPERLDITVFPNGFARGLFATVTPLGHGARATLTAALERIDTTLSGPLRLRLDTMRARTPDPRVARVFRIAPLGPRVLYTLRWGSRDARGHWQLSRPVQILAPVCPADFIDEDQR